MGEQKTTASSVNRAKTYQLVLFPLNLSLIHISEPTRPY